VSRSDDDGRAAGGRRWLLGIGAVVAIYAVGLAVVGVQDAVDALAAAALLPLLGALLLEAVTVGTLAGVHRSSARAVGHRLRYPEALEVSMTAFTLSQTLPGGGAVGAAVAVQRLRRHGLDGPQATASIALTGTLAFATIAAIAAAGAAVAVADAQLPGRVLALTVGASVVLLAGAVGVVALIRSPTAQDRVLGTLGRLHRRVRAALDRWRQDLAALEQAPPRGRDLARIVAWSSINWGTDIVALWLIFVAFGQEVDVRVLLIGFGAAQVGAAVPLTPGGVGFAESGMVGAFVALGVPSSEAATIVLTYRVLATWLPSLAGVVPLLRPLPAGSPTDDPRQ
jgi:putative heme transporter